MPTNDSVMSVLDELINGMDKQASDSTDYETGDPPATTGFRASENAADTKSDVPGESVDDTAAKETVSGAGEDTPTNTLGTVAAATGEDPEATEDTKDDPGSSHPATAGGEKYASTSDVVSGGNDLLANLLVFAKSAEAYSTDTNTDTSDSEGADDTASEDEEGDSTEDADGSDKEASYTKIDNFDLEKIASIETENVLVNKNDLVKLAEAAGGFVELLGYIQGVQASNNVLQEKVASDEFQKFANDAAYQAEKVASAEATALVEFLVGYKEAMLGGMDPAMLEAAGMGAPVEEEMAAPVEEEIPAELIEALVASLEGEGLAPEDIGGTDGDVETDALDEAQAAAAGEEVGSEGGDEEVSGEKVAQYTAAIKSLVAREKARQAKA